ncbi:MAG TPA: FeoB small GTPase domain-containing protein, partial [Longimicrobiales bacterium]
MGKSLLFNRLTGGYATVSNYPGTSVEVVRASARVGGESVQILDTPGLYSLLTTTEEERVAQRIVLSGEVGVIVHVVDMKSLPRMLPLTLQLLETGTPLVLALNMADEAERIGLVVDTKELAERLGVPVIVVSAMQNRGVEELRRAIARAVPGQQPVYENGVGAAIASVRDKLAGSYAVDPTALVSLLLQGDRETAEVITRGEPDGGVEAFTRANLAVTHFGGPSSYRIAVERQRMADKILDGVIDRPLDYATAWRDRIGDLLASPWTGV